MVSIVQTVCNSDSTVLAEECVDRERFEILAMSDNWRVRDAAFVPPPAASITSASGRGSTSLATRLGSSASTALVVPASATTSAAAVSSTVAVPDLVPAFETCPRGSRYPGPAPAAGPTGTVVVWFRGDLRLHDHPALTHAVEEAQKVVLVYCFDPRQFGKTPFGFEKTGESIEFTLHSAKAKGIHSAICIW